MILNKKYGNYVGKLKRDPSERAAYTLHKSSQKKEQIAAVMYDVPSLITQWRIGHPPRKIRVALPAVKDGMMDHPAISSKNKLMESPQKDVAQDEGLHILRSKEPIYECGQYRLNFSGRVSLASVKNMQIVNDSNELLLQFGKVNKHKFHLDYKAPFSALQAFALALASIDL